MIQDSAPGYWLRRITAWWRLAPTLFLITLACSPDGRPASPWRDFGVTYLGRPWRGRVFGQRHFAPLISDADLLALDRAKDTRERLLALARSVQPELSKGTPTEKLANTAVFLLLHEEWDQAISKLDQALDLSPHDPRILIDASAAYLERGVRLGRPLDLLEALRLSQNAQVRAPDSPEALFNFGQALQHLHLRSQEARVWQRYLELDPDGGWAIEVRGWLDQARDESFRREREACRRRIRDGEIQEDWLRRVVDIYPNEIREITEEELLGRWAQAARRGAWTEAGHQMSRVSLIAREFALQRGDRLLTETLEVLHTARTTDSGRWKRLIQAHLLFQQGMRSYRDQDFARAETLLGEADGVLRHAGSPLADSARFYRAVCVYYGNAEQVRPLLVSLLDTLPRDRSPSLMGRTFWMLGTVDMVQGRFEEAIRSFSAMREPLERGAGEGQAAMADILLAEASDLRGDVERGWEHRLRGMKRLTVEGTLRRRHSVLFEAAQALARRGQPEMSLLFLDEVLDNASLWRQPLARAEAYTLRSRVHLLLENRAEALKNAEQALAAIMRMQDGPLKTRTQGSALLSQGMALVEQQPRRALRVLEEAYKLQKDSSWEVERISYLNSRARAHLALHQVREARNFLEEAVQTYEAYRSDAMDPRSRITIFQHAQQSFDELMRLSWEDPDSGPRQAFGDSERARARTLLDAWSLHSAREVIPPADVHRVLRELPPGVTLVQYAVLPDQVLIWVFEGGQLRWQRRVLPATELEGLVRAFRRALQSSDPERARERGAQLYDLLLRDLLPQRPGQRLVIVPDGPLERIPFAALWDRASRSYLIKTAPLSMAPSATLFLTALRKSRRPKAPVTLLAVAPDLSSSPYAFLSPLPSAREEVRQIAALYPRASVLEGEQADSTRFSQALPKHSILHFAGHAVLLDPASARVFLLLAPRGAGDRGEASIESLRGLPLAHTDLVVLAACRTLNGYSPGREGALSIAGAFFAAGVPTVVASLWDVEDKLSLEFMSHFHQRIAAGEDAATALRVVMLHFVTSGDPEKSSPSAWGVFALLGA